MKKALYNKIDNTNVLTDGNHNKEISKNFYATNKSQKNVVYIVNAYIRMNIDTDDEFIQEVYATEELAKERVSQLIDAYKKGNEEYNDDTADEWFEEDYKLYAYSETKWGVEIFYEGVEVKNRL